MRTQAPADRANALYRTLWRWHFYTGLLVLPFIAVLALSGSVFLFKPQIDRWEERAFRDLPAASTSSPARQVAAALAAFPGSQLHSYRIPQNEADAALVHLKPAGTHGMRDVFVSPQGQVLGSLDADARIVQIARRIHGQLLLGPRGSWLVELAASWAIVMVITGLYLWWPRGRGAAGVLWPRRRSMLRDLHAVTGFWVSAFALVLLITGLPWAGVWGSAFNTVRTQMGWVKGTQEWTIGGETPTATTGPHDHHDHDASGHQAATANPDVLDQVVAQASAAGIAPPVLVLAPGAVQFGPPSPDWLAKSESQNRTLGQTIAYAAPTGAQLSRERFADSHPVDRVIGYGISWHEGALFGALNQAAGLFTALGLVAMSVTGFLMWRRRRPSGVLGAPALQGISRKPAAVALATLLLALLLPMLALSLLPLMLFDRLLPRISPAAAGWLGLVSASRNSNSQ